MNLPENDRVLIQCGDVLENMQRILSLAETLRARGMVPVMMTYSPEPASFFISRGFETVALDLYRKGVRIHNADCDRLPEEFFMSASFDIVYAAQTGNPETHGQAEKTIHAIRRIGVALQRLITDREIDWLIPWNGVTGTTAIAMRLIAETRSIGAGFMERGMLPGSLFYDRRGTNGASSLARGLVRQHSRAGIDAARVRKQAEIGVFTLPYKRRRAEQEPIVFVPLQVQADSNILLYSNHVKAMRQLVFRALDLARALGPHWKVLVRDHPEEVEPRLNLPFHPLVKRDNLTSLGEMLERSAVVMTINSTVGLSAALRGSIVVCHGEGIYCNEPFVIRAQDHDHETVVDLVRSALEQEADLEAGRDFAALYFDYHLVVPTDEPQIDNANVLCHFGTGNPTKLGPPLARLDKVRERLHQRVQTGAAIPVTFRLTFKEKILRSYRIEEEVNPRSYLATLAGVFPGIPFNFHRPGQQLTPAEAVLVLPAGETADDSDDFLAVLDQFGFPHVGTGPRPRGAFPPSIRSASHFRDRV